MANYMCMRTRFCLVMHMYLEFVIFGTSFFKASLYLNVVCVGTYLYALYMDVSNFIFF
jgi:hypothetical protein